MVILGTNRKGRSEVVLDDFKISKKFFEKLSTDVNWKPVFSDAVTINEQNEKVRVKLNLLDTIKLFLFSAYYTVPMANDMVLYPYTTPNRYLAFAYRHENGIRNSNRVSRVFAMILAFFLNIVWPFNRPRLVFEKWSERAQDSGFAYFSYVQRKYPKEKLYFLIKDDSPDFDRVKDMNRIVVFGSFKHFFLLHRSSLFISSETPGHAYYWRETMGITPISVIYKPYVFLQHGVVGLKKLDTLFRGDTLRAAVLFITSAKSERDIVVNQLGYEEEQVPVTGLARWDSIEFNSTVPKDKVLIFYTWRPWLDNVSDAVFEKSLYFQHLRETIVTLKSIQSDKEIVFMLHPKLETELSDPVFSGVTVWSDKTGPLSELLSSVSLIITDYSSVSWEGLYREIPVIFDMFDQERYLEVVDSYIDLNKIQFGTYVNDSVPMSLAVQQIADNNFELTIKEKQYRENFFVYRRPYASDRIHDEIAKLNVFKVGFKKHKKFMMSLIKKLK